MLTPELTRRTAATFVVALALSATGCSKTRDAAALTSLRGFTSSARAAGFAVVNVQQPLVAQRHARQPALFGIPTIQTLHHQAPRNF